MGIGAATGAGTGAGLELVFSLIGHLIANGERDQARKIYEENVKNMEAVDIPAFDQAIAQEVSKQQEVQADPTVREAQMGALTKMQSLAGQGGLDPQAMQSLQQARQSTDQQAHANQMGVQSSMQRRGMSGSGAELAGALQGSSAASNRGNAAGLDAASEARSRALQALSGSSQMAGQIRQGDFAQDNANRQAEFERQRFNSGLRTAAQQSNVAQRYARMNAQGKKAQGVNAAKSTLADEHKEGANRTERAWSGVGRGANKLATSAGEGYDAYSEDGFGGGGSMGGMMGGG